MFEADHDAKRSPVIPTLHIHLLGDFLLVSGDTTVTTVNLARLQSLLAYLVLHRTAPQARSHLAFLLWPDSDEAQAYSNLRKLLHQLRHYRSAHKPNEYQVWQEGSHPQAMVSDEIMRQKLEYLHNNPVKRGWVASPEHCHWSDSTRQP